MTSEPRALAVNLPRRARIAVAVATTVTALLGGGVWAMQAASAASGSTASASGSTASASGGTASREAAPAAVTTSPPGSSSASPTPSRRPSTRTSYTWTFEDGTPGGWYGFGLGNTFGDTTERAPWAVPSPEAARYGRGGLLVGELPRFGYQVGIDLSSDLLAPGRYAVTAQARLAPGQPPTRLGVGDFSPAGAEPLTTDAGWTTITGEAEVVPQGAITRLLIGPHPGRCETSFPLASAPASSFHLDQISVTRLAGSPTTTVPTTPVPTTSGAPTTGPSFEGTPSPTATGPLRPSFEGTPSPTTSPCPPEPQALLHYDVISTVPGGFTAALTIRNPQDRDHAISGWSVPLRLEGRRVLWVAGARLVQNGGVPEFTGTPGWITAAVPGQTTYRITFALSGSPVGSHGMFPDGVRQVPTGWE